MTTEPANPAEVESSPKSDPSATRRGPSNVKSAMTIRRTQALFDAMSGDHLFREQFVTDPAQIYSEYVNGTSLDRHRADVINQFVYAVLANDELLQWLVDYRDECQGAPPSDGEFARRFARAVVDQNAHHAAIALTRAASESQPLFPLDPAIKDVVFGLHGHGEVGFQTFLITQNLANTEVSTFVGTDPGTEMSTHTEMSFPPPPPFPPIPVTQTTITNVGPLIPDHFPGLGEGATRLVIDAVRAYALELRDGGALDDVGHG